MAKRLTDTDKWKDDWYVALNNDYRIIWQWLLDSCNHAGICKRSISILNIMCRTNISETELIEIMCGRVIIVNNNWFIPNFLKFQYTGLHSNKPVIVSAVTALQRSGCDKLIPESFGNDYLIIKSKSKDKDKDISNIKKNKNGTEGGFSGNFKARGEEVALKRLNEGLSELDRDRKNDSEGEAE